MSWITKIGIALGLLALPAQAQQPAAPASSPLETGRQYTAWFYAGEADKLWERFSPEMKKALGSADNLRAFRGQVEAQAGTETAVEDEKVTPEGGFQIYTRKVKFSKAPVPLIVQWTLDASGIVAGFFVRPDPSAPPKEAESRYLNYKTKAPLRLPFNGEWFVFWGGRSVGENYHAASRDQRFAYDIVIVKDGKSHTGDGSSNEQYFCFGQPLLAPGAGKVTVVVDGIADNKPGVMNREQVPGNHVVIDHGNGEFSFLAHFKKGSIAVKPGDQVKAGQTLGLCGNSGNSSEPHLHYHLQNTGILFEGDGLPAQFLDFIADGKPVERGEPRKGQQVRPQ